MCCSSWSLFFLCFILLHSVTPTAAVQLQAGPYVCSESGNYSSNSTYRANLDSVLASMTSNTEIDYGFYNFSAGQNSDKVNAIALCRGDISTDECRRCVNASSYDLVQVCPNEKEAIIWYSTCSLRYSNRSILGVMEDNPLIVLYNIQNDTDVKGFNELLTILLERLSDVAASGIFSPRKFAMGNMTAPYYHYVYALVECTPDLDELECKNCLARIVSYIPQCCDGKQGGKYVTPSCDIRFETYVFTDPAAEAPQPSQFNVTDPPLPPTEGKKTNIKVIVIISVIIGTLFMAISTLLLWRWLAKRKGKNKKTMLSYFRIGETNQKIPGENEVGDKISQVELQELPVFSLEELASATNNFHESNKLGQGGFGPVYRGKLLDGQEIAAKRLARSSGQGLQEFMNEVVVISKLQHRNLVRILGCCVDGEEKMLVYEYMPNKSLDAFLFDPVQQKLLDWRKRFNIMEGIGRGLLYLHRDSRLRIIHRDLKPSNILLDGQLNPKISDFGMAKIFGGDEDQANTKRVVGTYGYMSPEYAMEGRFSEKSDVFSFGVVLLEIISGRRNTSFYYDEDAMSLLGFAWKMWNAGNIVAIVDPMLCEPCSESEILRCIQVALLCVQEFAEDRPTVSVVISMIKSEIVDLPNPKQPAFAARESTAPGRDSSQGNQRICSINNVTVTMVEGR